MFFYLENRFTNNPPGVNILPPEAKEFQALQEHTLHLQAGKQRIESLQMPGGGRLLLLGDPVFQKRENPAESLCTPDGLLDLRALYAEIRGHYNWFYVQPGALSCGNSFGALFPVYYQIRNDRILLSSSVFFLGRKLEHAVPDRRHLLERLLFNYPFFQSTGLSGIRLLETHRRIRISETGARVDAPFAVEDYFGSGQENSGESLMRLTELFESETRLFLPDAPFAVSFTGGFDGRTLVAAARKAGRSNFFTYSFGMPGESDVSFPAAQSKALGIPFLPVYLDNDYVERHALESAWAFMRGSEFNGNFGRPHYHHAARILAGKTNFILTGNFGSELFRAMHNPGVMMSEALIRIFTVRDNSWKDFLRESAGKQAATFFQVEMDALIADLEQYLAEKKELDPNQRFYVFVLEEIFRKYFGPELVMQSHYLCNRTPYLSFRFFRALNETVWSGVHARLFEKQKNKRLKGQIFYSAFLQGADRQFYRLPTNKGYSPADVLEKWRRPLLLAKVARQKFFRRETGDSNAVETWFTRYYSDLMRKIGPREYPELLLSGLASFLDKDSPEPDTMEKTIHYSSLAAAWAAAAQVSKPATSNQIV